MWLALVAPGQAEVDAARAAEERAFAAIDEERWCDAAHRFMDANDIAPSVDLIYNAAQAADYAGDRKLALHLYTELIGAYPGSDRQAAVNQRMVEITSQVSKQGVGKSCPDRPAPPEPAPASVDKAGKVEDTAPDEAPTGDASDVVAAPPPATAGNAGGGISFLPWIGVALAAAVVAGGAGLVGVGGSQYVAYFMAHNQINDAQANGTDVPDGVHDQQTNARAAWESWAEPTFLAGIATAAVATALVAAAVTWGVVDVALSE